MGPEPLINAVFDMMNAVTGVSQEPTSWISVTNFQAIRLLKSSFRSLSDQKGIKVKYLLL